MFDAFNKAAAPDYLPRRHNSGTLHFSPSYGVRHGLIKDPNWPPAHMPDDGNAARRRHVRVNCSFEVRVSGTAAGVTGDLSAGGARFTLDHDAGDDVEVIAGGQSARAHVIEVIEAKGQYIHRVLFDDFGAGSAVFAAVSSAQPAGGP
jgi:hypothetical protein